MATKSLVVGSDHAGLNLKNTLIEHLKSKGIAVTDVGTYTLDSVDYPDVAATVGQKVVEGEADAGVLVCGSGIGMSIAANKVKGVRAALCHDHYSAVMSRRHNDANVLALGERSTGVEVAKEIVDAFLDTPFDGGKHQMRVRKIAELDKHLHSAPSSE